MFPHSERSEEPLYLVFAFVVVCSFVLYTNSKFALARFEQALI
jgi:hypothetical protein